MVINGVDGERTWRLKVRTLSQRAPVPLGKGPHIDVDWVVVCNRLRTESPVNRLSHDTRLKAYPRSSIMMLRSMLL